MPTATATRARKRLSKAEQDRRIQIEIDIDTYNPVFRECRDILHAWTILGYFVSEGEPYRKEGCVRCSTTKNRHMVPGGKSMNYRNPEGYRLPGVTRQDFRDLALKQAAPHYESEEELLEALELADKRRRRRTAARK